MAASTLQDDPRWIEHREAITLARIGRDSSAGERYRDSLPGYVSLLADRTPPIARLAMMTSLLDGEHVPLGIVLAGFQASAQEREQLEDRPPLQAEPVDEIERLQRMPYQDYLKTEHWRHVRAAAVAYAEHRCMFCYLPKALEVHHRTYDRRGCERPSDVIALCADCHRRGHGTLRAIS